MWLAESDFTQRMHIHQGRKKCGREPNQHDRTASAGQTKGTRGQVENHSAVGPNCAQRPPAEERPSATGTPSDTQTSNQPKQLERIKWPQAKDQEEWCWIDKYMSGVLEHSLSGKVEHKLNTLSNIIYEECRERGGESTIK